MSLDKIKTLNLFVFSVTIIYLIITKNKFFKILNIDYKLTIIS